MFTGPDMSDGMNERKRILTELFQVVQQSARSRHGNRIFAEVKSFQRFYLEVILKKVFRLEKLKYPTRVMFPTTHEIFPEILDECMEALFRLLRAGHAVLIVSKPRLECIEQICECFTNYRKQILFRFSIGSPDDERLRIWEPNAPDFAERLACLQHVHRRFYATSVSCEPVLDRNTLELLSQVGPWCSTTFWIGTANMLQSRLALNKAPEEIRAAGRFLEEEVSAAYIHNLYSVLRTHEGVRWKDSCQKILGLRKGGPRGG